MSRVPLTLIVIALSACASPSATEPPPDEPPDVALPWRASTDYADALVRADSAIESARRRADAQPTSWLPMESLAWAYADRGRLTGDLEDYARAVETLDEAFTRAPEGGGPHLSRASLAFTVHRLDAMEPALARAEGGAIAGLVPQAEIEGLRGDLALHRLRIDAAATHYDASETLEPNMPAAFRLAMHEWHRGRFDAADARIVESLERLGTAPRTQAFLHLQRGIFDLSRGRYDDALAHYHDADAAFGGWWLIHEHIAEIHALRGDDAIALAAYRDVVARTQSPELMGALAGVLEERGEADEAMELTARAEAIYEAQLELLPEAAYGHALDHFLGTYQAERALTLSRANFALRPNGESHVALARALALVGDEAEALDVIEVALASPYRSSELHATASVLYARGGDADAASEQRALAESIQPDVFEQVQWWSGALP